MSSAMTSSIHARLTEAQRAEWDRVGAADWLRAALDLSANASRAGIAMVEQQTGTIYRFELLDRWCAAHGVPALLAECPVNGKVSAWPAEAWLQVYEIDLNVIFGKNAS